MTTGFHSLCSRQPLLSGPFVSGYLVFSFSILPLSLCFHSPTGNGVISTNDLFPSSTDIRYRSYIVNFLTRKMSSADSRMRMKETVVRRGGLNYTFLFFLGGSRLTMHRIMENETKYNTARW